MSHRLAVAAVIAHDRRLDDAGAFGVGAGRDGEREVRGVIRQVQQVRGVQWVRKGGLVWGCDRGALHPGNRLTHHRAEFVVGHSWISMLSMMPTMAASTGAPLRPSASPAARPSSTISTFSRTPAPTESMASSGGPRVLSSSVTGCTSNNFAPSNLRCFCVETTVPITRAICIGRRAAEAGPYDPGSTS